jgi:hypothetical protein
MLEFIDATNPGVLASTKWICAVPTWDGPDRQYRNIAFRYLVVDEPWVFRASNAAPTTTPTPAPRQIPRAIAQPPTSTPTVTPMPAPTATPKPA